MATKHPDPPSSNPDLDKNRETFAVGGAIDSTRVRIKDSTSLDTFDLPSDLVQQVLSGEFKYSDLVQISEERHPELARFIIQNDKGGNFVENMHLFKGLNLEQTAMWLIEANVDEAESVVMNMDKFPEAVHEAIRAKLIEEGYDGRDQDLPNLLEEVA